MPKGCLLLEKARNVLVEQLEGDDEKRRFEAAKSLFSFRAQQPPAEGGPTPERVGGSFSVADMIRTAAELKVLSQLGVDEQVEAKLAGRLADTPVPRKSQPRSQRGLRDRPQRTNLRPSPSRYPRFRHGAL